MFISSSCVSSAGDIFDWYSEVDGIGPPIGQLQLLRQIAPRCGFRNSPNLALPFARKERLDRAAALQEFGAIASSTETLGLKPH
jgi:hypothetical protein